MGLPYLIKGLHCNLLKHQDDPEAADWYRLWREFARLTNAARDWDVCLESAQRRLPKRQWAALRPLLEAEVAAAHELLVLDRPQRVHRRDEARVVHHLDRIFRRVVELQVVDVLQDGVRHLVLQDVGGGGRRSAGVEGLLGAAEAAGTA